MTRTILALAAVTTCLIGQYPGQANPAEQCDAGHRASCEQLAIETGGQCASPGGLGGCRFDSTRYKY